MDFISLMLPPPSMMSSSFCIPCNRQFRYPQALLDHQLSHHPPPASPITNRWPAPAIQAQQTPFYPYTCTLCYNFFDHPSTLYSHLTTTHWGCQDCGLFFARQSDLTTHITTVHYPPSPPSIFHNGNYYSILTSTDGARNSLLQLCHSKATLHQQGYFPSPTSANLRRTPHSSSEHFAISLDCEMGQSVTGEHVLIQLCAVSYFTGQVLISSLVKPTSRLKSLNTRYSGITQEMLDTAISRGDYIDGVFGAQESLFQFVGEETVLIGHALKNDLAVLGVEHDRIVDTEILYPGVGGKRMGLRGLCGMVLGIDVQRGEGVYGHNCLEDAFAAREVVVWCVQHPKDVSERQLRTELIEDAVNVSEVGSTKGHGRDVAESWAAEMQKSRPVAAAKQEKAIQRSTTDSSLRELSLSCLQLWQTYLTKRGRASARPDISSAFVSED